MKNKKQQQVAETLKLLIEEKIRPAIQQHGGDIKFIAYDNGTLKIELSKACISCPYAKETIENNIAKIVSFFVPEVTKVCDVNISDM